MKVAALLDSDAAGDQAAQQEHLVHALGNKNILRTKDFCSNVLKPEIEDLLRETLITIVKDDFGVDENQFRIQTQLAQSLMFSPKKSLDFPNTNWLNLL